MTAGLQIDLLYTIFPFVTHIEILQYARTIDECRESPDTPNPLQQLFPGGAKIRERSAVRCFEYLDYRTAQKFCREMYL